MEEYFVNYKTAPPSNSLFLILDVFLSLVHYLMPQRPDFGEFEVSTEHRLEMTIDNVRLTLEVK